MSRRQNIIVSLAGPGAGFLLAAPVAAYAVGGIEEGSFAARIVEQALWVNVGWGVLNLLPILPLDGGHVMEASLASWLGASGPRVARYVSLVAAIGAGVLALAHGMLWGAMMAFFAASFAWRTLGGPHGDGTVPARSKVAPELARAVDAVWALLRTGDAERSIEACEQLLEMTATFGPEDVSHQQLRARVVEALAWAHLENGDERAARAAVERMPPSFSPSAFLEARLLYATGDRIEGLRAMERAFHDSNDDVSALALAAVYIELGRPHDVVAMLRTIRGARLDSSAHHTIAAALFYADAFAESLAACELAWNRTKSADHAYNAACASARLGKVDLGIDWLERALAAGFSDREQLATDEDLAPLRTSPRFPTAPG